MKKIWFSLFVIFGALIISGCVREPQANIISGLDKTQSGIWVNGEGKVTAIPDVLFLNVGIESQAKSVGEAQSKAREAMSKVRQAISTMGIEPKDVMSTQYGIQPVYQYNQKENKQELIGYRVSDRLSIKIRNIQNAGKTIDATAEAGGNLIRIDSIHFGIDDNTTYKNEARGKAIKDALTKARQMADLAGVKLGKPVYITESGFVQPQPRPVLSPLMARAESAAAPTEISPGEAEIQVQVQIVFNIEK